MRILVELTDLPIPAVVPQGDDGKEVGAHLEFRGVVRGVEDGRPIRALRYEAYAPMAQAQMERILRSLEDPHACLAARVIHRHGLVPVGEAAIFVGIRARHREEAFAMLAGFMDRLKKDVPIWKVETVPA
jgi:molybdopterin synthase catalytic subunit